MTSLVSRRITIDRKHPVGRRTPDPIEACLRGDKRAWDEIVERYGRLVYSIPRRYGMSDADADEVFQNVFLILFRRLRSLEDRERLSAWLITTTHRECWRIGRQSGMVGLDEQIADVGEPNTEDAVRWEQQHLVRVALETLGGRCEALLQRLFLNGGGGSYEDIARELGMKAGSIGPTRARCFRKLERILVDLGVHPPVDDAIEASGDP